MAMYTDYDEIFTVSELAEYLKIGLNAAYTLVKSGKIASFRVGNSYRIHRSEIVNYMLNKSHN